MSTTNKPTRGKVLLHGVGTGGVTENDVMRRARELAAINGRSSAALTEKDLAQARMELTGEYLPPTTGEDAESSVAVTRDPSEPLSDSGHQIPDLADSDEGETAESLTEEGVEEAQHEQMLAARRRARQEDGKG